MSDAKRIVIHKPGGYQQLNVEAFTPRLPEAHEVIVKTKAVGINYADICVRWGIYESAKKYVGWPITPGFEFSGYVDTVGSDVTSFKVGDAVFGVSRFNSYASHVTVDAGQLFTIPQGLSFEEAAAMPSVSLTAYHALFQHVVIRPNAKILIHSAAGGVGSCLVQFAKLKGYQVFGIVGNPKKKDYVLALGANAVVSKREEDWATSARNFSPKGFDVILDANGYATLKKGFDLLAPMGKLISYGFHSMLPKEGGRINWIKLVSGFLKTPRFNPINMTAQNKSLVTFNLSFLFEEMDLFKAAMQEIIHWIETKQIKKPTVQTFSFENVAEAHQALESGNTVGKLILTLE